MLDLQEFLWGFSILSLLFCSLRGLTKALPMALSLYSPSSSAFPSPPISWVSHMLLGNQATSENALPPNKTHDEPQDHNINNSLQNELLKEGSDSLTMANAFQAPNKLRKRPGKLVVPEYCPVLEFTKLRKKMENQEFQVQGRHYCLATKKGRRETLEDAYGVMLDIFGDSKQVII